MVHILNVVENLSSRLLLALALVGAAVALSVLVAPFAKAADDCDSHQAEATENIAVAIESLTAAVAEKLSCQTVAEVTELDDATDTLGSVASADEVPSYAETNGAENVAEEASSEDSPQAQEASPIVEVGLNTVYVHLTITFSENSPIPFPLKIERTFEPGTIEVYVNPGVYTNHQRDGRPTSAAVNTVYLEFLNARPLGWTNFIFWSITLCGDTGHFIWTAHFDFFYIGSGSVGNDGNGDGKGDGNGDGDNGDNYDDDNGDNGDSDDDTYPQEDSGESNINDTNNNNDANNNITNNNTERVSAERVRERSSQQGPNTGDVNNSFAQVAALAALIATLAFAGLVSTKNERLD